MRRLHLPIHDPCHEDWDAMRNDGEAQRFCDVCTKQVHDLSAMTERRARDVLAEESAKGRVCVRYRSDTAGKIRFLPEPARTTSAWRMSLAAAGMSLMMLAGCADSQPTEVRSDHCVYEVGPWSFTAERGEGSCPAPDEEHELLGKVAIDPEPEPEMGEPPAPPPEVLGEIEPVEEIQGKIAEPIELQPEEIEIMGDLAWEPEQPAEPCDPTDSEVPNSLI